MKAKFLANVVLTNVQDKQFIHGKCYEVHDIDDEYLAIRAPMKAKRFVKVPKTEIGKMFEIID